MVKGNWFQVLSWETGTLSKASTSSTVMHWMPGAVKMWNEPQAEESPSSQRWMTDNLLCHSFFLTGSFHLFIRLARISGRASCNFCRAEANFTETKSTKAERDGGRRPR